MSLQSIQTYQGQPSSNGVNHLVSGVTGKRIYVIAYLIQGTGMVSANFQDTVPNQLSPAWSLGATAPAVAGVRNAAQQPGSYLFVTATGAGLDLNLSGAVGVNCEVQYFVR